MCRNAKMYNFLNISTISFISIACSMYSISNWCILVQGNFLSATVETETVGDISICIWHIYTKAHGLHMAFRPHVTFLLSSHSCTGSVHFFWWTTRLKQIDPKGYIFASICQKQDWQVSRTVSPSESQKGQRTWFQISTCPRFRNTKSFTISILSLFKWLNPDPTHWKYNQDLFLNICLKTTKYIVSFLHFVHASLTFGFLFFMPH